jgi:hypothetical protein
VPSAKAAPAPEKTQIYDNADARTHEGVSPCNDERMNDPGGKFWAGWQMPPQPGRILFAYTITG